MLQQNNPPCDGYHYTRMASVWQSFHIGFPTYQIPRRKIRENLRRNPKTQPRQPRAPRRCTASSATIENDASCGILAEIPKGFPTSQIYRPENREIFR
jgi:hypothetical protein